MDNNFVSIPACEVAEVLDLRFDDAIMNREEVDKLLFKKIKEVLGGSFDTPIRHYDFRSDFRRDEEKLLSAMVSVWESAEKVLKARYILVIRNFGIEVVQSV